VLPPTLFVVYPSSERLHGHQTIGESQKRSAADKNAKMADAELGDALEDYYRKELSVRCRRLPIWNTPKNETGLTSSIQVANRSLNYGDDGKQPAAVKLAGIILTYKGKIAASFKNQLNVSPLKVTRFSFVF
jgi:hypothetical protein